MTEQPTRRSRTPVQPESAGIASATPTAAKPVDLADVQRTCDVCACGDFMANTPTGYCRARSPHHQIMLVPTTVKIDGQPPVELKGYSQWPIVFRDNWCIHDFQLKAGAAQ